MRKVSVFESISADGFFCDRKNDISWAHRGPDPEFDRFTAENAGGEATALFGRVTYEMMKSYWPTPQAREQAGEVAEGMNRMEKIVFSRTLKEPGWQNVRVIAGDPVAAVRELKQGRGPDLLVMGSGSIVSQLTQARLVDDLQLVVVPVVLGQGRTLFEGVKDRLELELTRSRTFKNGNVVLWYESAR